MPAKDKTKTPLLSGNLLVNARDTLNVVPDETLLKKTKKDKVSFPFFRVLLGLGSIATDNMNANTAFKGAQVINEKTFSLLNKRYTC